MTKNNRGAVDTNVLVHLLDEELTPERRRAAQLLGTRLVVSQPVISEFLNVTRRLLKLPKGEILRRCNEVFARCEIVPISYQTLTFAARLLARYDFQLFDAIIVAAALEAGCDTLYSADFQHNQLVEGRLRLLNPFR